MVDRDYDIPIDGEVRTVVDLGANAGQSSIYLRDRYPDASILAVEADPDTARLAARNTDRDPDTVVLSAAASDHDGTTILTRLPGKSWGSNLFSAWSTSESQRVEVRSVTLATLFREYGLNYVDLLKVDIEGAELMALTSDRALEQVRVVVGEFHPSILKMDAETLLMELKRHGRFSRAWMRSECIFALARFDDAQSTLPASQKLPAMTRAWEEAPPWGRALAPPSHCRRRGGAA